MSPLFSWILIAFCLTQSAMFSGLNLAFFSVSRLRLEAEAELGNLKAIKVLRLRTNANLLLCTILWGNVSVNVLLAMLSDSVMAGVAAFLFATVGITFFGEIMPQAWFSRNALKAGSLLAPVIRVYQFLLYPVARPSAAVLDRWIGPEGPMFLGERDFEVLLERHIRERHTDISLTEGRGALNFLRLDDLRVSGEGAAVDPNTVTTVETDENGGPIIPGPDSPEGGRFVDWLQETNLKWAILTDPEGKPLAALNADEFLRQFHNSSETPDPRGFCHQPIVVDNPHATLDQVLPQLVVEPGSFDDRLVDREVILYWGANSKRIITGPDLLGRLLHGIAERTAISEDSAATS